MEKKPRKFSTRNADYCLNYGNHLKETNIERIKDFDALVLETGFELYESATLENMINLTH